MSQMTLSIDGMVEFKVWVLDFQAPLSQSFVSGQTKMMIQHFPIKTSQPNLEFTIQFVDEIDYERFQQFIRQHQLTAMRADNGAEIRIWWPERNIQNFTGYVREFEAGGQRFNIAPVAKLSIDLIDSMVSQKTDASSFAAEFMSVVGRQLMGFTDWSSWENLIFKPPDPPRSTEENPSNSGGNS